MAGSYFEISEDLVNIFDGMREKLGCSSIKDVISFSFQLVAYLDEMEKSGGKLVYMNPEGKMFKVSLSDMNINNEAIEQLKANE